MICFPRNISINLHDKEKFGKLWAFFSLFHLTLCNRTHRRGKDYACESLYTWDIHFLILAFWRWCTFLSQSDCMIYKLHKIAGKYHRQFVVRKSNEIFVKYDPQFVVHKSNKKTLIYVTCLETYTLHLLILFYNIILR